MRHLRPAHFLLSASVPLLAALAGACSSTVTGVDTGSTTSTGGHSGTAGFAGSSGTGGLDGSGGTPTAGAPGSGGVVGSGGTTATTDGGGSPTISCTGQTPYFPAFDKTCTTDSECIVVSHTTSCCGSALLMGIRDSAKDAFDAAEAICDAQYPACGCAAQGVSIETGQTLPDSLVNQVAAQCLSGACTTTYTGPTFACGERNCFVDLEYCSTTLPGVSGGTLSYACQPLPFGCTDCSCLILACGTCSASADGGPGLTVTCATP